MTIAVERTGDVAVLRPHDRLDVSTVEPFERATRAAFDGGARHLAIDLSTVTYLSSAGIGALVKCAQLARTAGGRVALCGLGESVAQVLAVTNVLKLFDRHGAVADAIAALGAHEAGASAPAAPPAEDTSSLSLPEAILLLALREEDGRFIELPAHALDHALAGAVLMELAMRRRIDGDLERLTVADATPLGDELLDPVLACLARAESARDARRWIRVLVVDAEEIRRRTVDRLVARGVLRRGQSRLHRAFVGHRSPVLDHAPRREVRDRILAIVRSDAIPDPRDIVVIALAEACAVFDALLDEDAMLEARPRILEIAGMDLFAQSMARALVAVQQADREADAAGAPEVRIFGGANAPTGV